MFVVVSYDIPEDKKRTRLMKLLKNYGVRVQKSVFECRLDEKGLLEMKGKVRELIDPEEDSVRYYDLCARCQRLIEFTGEPPKTEDEEFVVV